MIITCKDKLILTSDLHLNPSIHLLSFLSCVGVGVPVYMYEFVYRAEIHKHTRPSFVKADHADDVGFMFGGCFWNGRIKIIGKCYMSPIVCTYCAKMDLDGLSCFMCTLVKAKHPNMN